MGQPLDLERDAEREGLSAIAAPLCSQAVAGLVASGAQAVLFTTGRGALRGFPIAPVVKVCGNPRTCEFSGEHIDVDVSRVIEGGETVEDAGRRALG